MEGLWSTHTNSPGKDQCSKFSFYTSISRLQHCKAEKLVTKPLKLGEVYLYMLTPSFKQLNHPLVLRNMEAFRGTEIASIQSPNSLGWKKKCACVCLCGCHKMCMPVAEREKLDPRGLLTIQPSWMSEPQANEKHCLRDTVLKLKVDSSWRMAPKVIFWIIHTGTLYVHIHIQIHLHIHITKIQIHVNV